MPDERLSAFLQGGPQRVAARESLADIGPESLQPGPLCQILLRALQFQEETNLATQAAKHPQQRLVRLPHLAGKKLDDAEDVLPEGDGKTKCGVETLLRGNRGPRKGHVGTHVRNPHRRAAIPDGARQSLAAGKGLDAAGGLQLFRVSCRRVPDVHTAKGRGVRVHLPECPEGTAQSLAEGLQDSFLGIGLGCRFRQDLGHGVLEGQVLFGDRDLDGTHLRALPAALAASLAVPPRAGRSSRGGCSGLASGGGLSSARIWLRLWRSEVVT